MNEDDNGMPIILFIYILAYMFDWGYVTFIMHQFASIISNISPYLPKKYKKWLWNVFLSSYDHQWMYKLYVLTWDFSTISAKILIQQRAEAL